MRPLFSFLVISIAVILTACPQKNDTLFKGDCPFERVNWMKVTTTYDKTKVANLAGKIGAAASVDSSVLTKIVQGNANVSFGDSLAKTLQEITKDSVEVSQEFYQEYLKQRQAVCQLWTFGKDPKFRTDKDFMKRLQDQYFEITKNFGQIQQEEKKNQR